MQGYRLGLDLAKHLEPWAYARLNIVERILLAQRIQNEAPNAARHVRELWEMIPPNAEEADHLFETALRGRAMENETRGALGDLETAKKQAEIDAPQLAPMSPAPAPAAAAPVDAFAAPPGSGGGFGKGMGIGGTSGTTALRRSMTVDELKALKDSDADRMAVPKEMEELAAGRTMTLSGALSYTGGTTVNAGTLVVTGGTLGYFGKDVAGRARQEVRVFYRALGPTKEWAEKNYYKRRIDEQDAELITVNAFWRDYAAWVAAGSKGGFVSANIAEACHSFPEMMLALAVLDLPFETGPLHSSDAAEVLSPVVLCSRGGSPNTHTQ